MKFSLSEFLDADQQAATDGQDPSQPPSALSLDDRANLYLNAVYGLREFTDSEYDSAREIILDALVADVGEDHKTNDNGVIFPGGVADPELGRTVQSRMLLREANHFESRPEMGPEALSAHLRPDAKLPGETSLSKRPKVHSTETALAAIAEALDIPDSAPHSRDMVDMASRRTPARLRSQMNIRTSEGNSEPTRTTSRSAAYSNPLRNTAGRRFAIRFALIAAGLVLVVVGGAAFLTLLPMTDLPTLKTGMVAQFSPQDRENKSTAVTQLRQLDTSALDRMVKLADRLISEGDLYAGRLILTEAAEGGHAPAAFALGATYDPNEIGPPKALIATSDIEKSRFWYERAKRLGSSEAQSRLDRLANNKR